MRSYKTIHPTEIVTLCIRYHDQNPAEIDQILDKYGFEVHPSAGVRYGVLLAQLSYYVNLAEGA